MRTPPASAGRAFSRAAAALTVALAAGGAPAFAAPDDVEPPVAVAPPAAKVVADAPPAGPGAPLSLLRQLHERTSEMAVAAMDFVGIRYRRGGESTETGFDCSGFTRHVFAMSLGMMLPRRADEQATAPGFVAVRRDDLHRAISSSSTRSGGRSRTSASTSARTGSSTRRAPAPASAPRT
jgi:cell wall-associated NlpC family hydrolase